MDRRAALPEPADADVPQAHGVDVELPQREHVELLDSGDGRRLERFGARVVDRPAPAATERRSAPGLWRHADLRFDSGLGWSGPAAPGGIVEPWLVAVDGLTLELRATTSGGIGMYPEHLANLPWLRAQIDQPTRRQPTILNLFAHTGLATLAAARAGAAVVHLDAQASTLAWARRNAHLSNLADRPIRWIVDDALAFVARERRRGRRYDGLILDPPTFGRSGRRQWHLASDLPALLAGCASIATEHPFVLLSAHTEGLEGIDLARMLAEAFGTPARRIDTQPLELEAASGARLALGWSARLGAVSP